MKFPLQKLKAATDAEPLRFENDVDISELEQMNNDIRSIPPVHVKGSAVTRGEEITFTFTVAGSMTLPCARTLTDVEYPFSFEVSEVFSLSRYHQEGEEEIHEIDGEILDLTPYIKENVILEVPLQVFADEKVLDNAPEEGQGWQLVTEQKQEEKVDPRLAKLQNLLNEENE
ncbi:YceD family protein [Pontibacillus yanchengensis]|uniref:DUF177 domain-containing protein n=1 Tax=Pontibacillus yanchengensis Y32 TaxID=1385514 RepID=A0A0A2TT61_9BACI|nr:YceD family protein [Pontibacillus yanchengensis]KGP72445.1 hypothetical protein N782_05945 [Pontibacillus yanchengensis Y32]